MGTAPAISDQGTASATRRRMVAAFERHWPEYLMEAAELGLFMVSACLFGIGLEYPAPPVHQAIADPFLRRVLMGMAIGLAAIGIIYFGFFLCDVNAGEIDPAKSCGNESTQWSNRLCALPATALQGRANPFRPVPISPPNCPELRIPECAWVILRKYAREQMIYRV
jgi:hypothetical protein